MTNRVFKSKIESPEKFSEEVSAYAAELLAWHGHMGKVKATPETHQAYPPPRARADVVLSLRQEEKTDGTVTVVPDYEIIDDGPSPADRLVIKKSELFDLVDKMETVATTKIIAPGKMRLQFILAKEAGDKKPEDRTKDEAKFLADHDSLQERLAAVARHAAELHSEIEDLDLASAETWTTRPFPESKP